MQNQELNARSAKRELARIKKIARRALHEDRFDSAAARVYVKRARALEFAARAN